MILLFLITDIFRPTHALLAEEKKLLKTAFLKDIHIIFQICVQVMGLLSITTLIIATHFLLQDDPQQQTEHTEHLPISSWYIETHKEQLQRLLQSRPLLYNIQDKNADWMIFLIWGYTDTTSAIEQQLTKRWTLIKIIHHLSSKMYYIAWRIRL